MKKKIKNETDDELRPEYDLRKLLKGGVRGKYAARNRTKKKSALSIDRRVILILSSFDDQEYYRYWHSRTPQARLRYMEELRRMNYGNLATKRLSRVLEVAEREKN